MKERKVIYHPEFIAEYKKFYDTYGEKNAPDVFKRWIKNNKFDPELPLSAQIREQIKDVISKEDVGGAIFAPKVPTDDSILPADHPSDYKVVGSTSAQDYLDYLAQAWSNTVLDKRKKEAR